MRHTPVFGSLILTAASLIPSLAAQNDPAAQPHGPKVTLRSHLDQLLAQNPSLTPDELSRAKAQFRTTREKDRVMGMPAAVFMRPSDGSPTFPVPELPEFEQEHNDSIGYADPFTGSIKGAMDSNTDVDVYEFVVPADGRLQLSVQPSGAMPLGDPSLLVTDSKGQTILFNDDSGGTTYPAIDAQVPAGTYYLQVVGFNGDQGTYQLNAASTPSPFQMLTSGQPVADQFTTTAEKGYTLVVPTDSKVNLTTIGGFALDLFVVVINSRGGLHEFLDDSTVGGLDPALDSYLPAGTYHFILGELGGMTGSYSLLVTLTPMAIPPIAPGGTVTATAAGPETLPLYQLDLAQAQQVHFQSAPAGGNPLPDPGFTLYDRDLAEIFFQDDDRSSLYSSLQLPLPAGTYYLLWESVDGSSGTLDVTTTGSPLGAPPPVNLGRNFSVLNPGPGTVLFGLESRTADHVEVNVGLTGTMADSQLAVLDSSGGLVGANDDYLNPAFDSLVGEHLPAGNHWFLVREFTNLGGSFQLDVRSTIFYSDAVTTRQQLNVVGKSGEWMGALVAALQETPTPLPVPFPLTGLILLDLNPSIFLGIGQIPPSGHFVWPFDFSPFPIILQGLTVNSISLPMLTRGHTTLVVH